MLDPRSPRLSPRRPQWTRFRLDSVESIGCQMQQPPTPSSSFRSMLMASAVQRPPAPHQNQDLEDKGQKKKEEQTLLLLFSPPTPTPRPAGCDPSPLTLTHDSWSHSHATPLCVHLAWQHLGHRCCCHGNRWTGGLAITSFSAPSPPAQHRGQSAPPHTHTHTHDPSHGSHTYLDTHCVLSQPGQTCYSPQSPWIHPLSGPIPQQTCPLSRQVPQQTCPLRRHVPSARVLVQALIDPFTHVPDWSWHMHGQVALVGEKQIKDPRVLRVPPAVFLVLGRWSSTSSDENRVWGGGGNTDPPAGLWLLVQPQAASCKAPVR